MNKAESAHVERVASVGCCICRRLYGHFVPAQIHHVATGSGVRSHFAVAGLCPEHHLGGSGFHTMGKQFLKLFRVPGESEYGLLVMVNDDIAKYGRSHD